MLQSSSGALWRVKLPSFEPEELINFHAGTINGAVACADRHVMASIGIDGSVRLHDYVNKITIYSRHCAAGGTCIAWLPKSLDGELRSIATGHTDGVVRILVECRDGVRVKACFKPHTKAVVALAFSLDGETLATAGEDNTIFFIGARDNWRPIGYINTDATINCLTWGGEKGDRLAVAHKGGGLAEYAAPKIEDYDTTTT